MAVVQNIKKLVDRLRDKAARARRDGEGDVVVGFTAAYAIFVHEDMQAKHRVGQAKFLEQPARTGRNEMHSIIVKALAKGKTLMQALLLAGLWLQRQAMLLTPVDTGNLRNSAFTRME